MIRPDELKRSEPLTWSPGLGTDVWELFSAIIGGDLEGVRRLLAKDPSLVRCQYMYRTPIYFAVRENRLDIAAYLLERGADPLSLAVDDSLLEICRDRGHAEMERLLETHHARVRFAGRGDVEKASLFIDRGADLHARDDHNRSTPLGWAAKCGRIASVELLLRRGARPRLPDDPPWAVPLQWAVRRGHREVADLLSGPGSRSP